MRQCKNQDFMAMFSDIQAVRSNMRKARKVWACLSLLLHLYIDNATPRASGMFYKATIQAVLLFLKRDLESNTNSTEATQGFSCTGRMEDAKGQQTSTGHGDRQMALPFHQGRVRGEEVLACLPLHTIFKFSGRQLQTTYRSQADLFYVHGSGEA